ncbi:MAG: PadR family transcriptional regulator [Caproiciproducens sp.]|nr:PadR family transcriptional regulator [Caproiciproducens sp.]
MDIQIKKGLLDVCVLAVINKKDSYGYQIIKDVSICIEISESTLYPILKRLEAGGCLSTYSMEHNGRLRKYYRITALGKQRINDFFEEWSELERINKFILQEGNQSL